MEDDTNITELQLIIKGWNKGYDVGFAEGLDRAKQELTEALRRVSGYEDLKKEDKGGS